MRRPLVIMLIILVALELAARGLSPFLPPQKWGNFEIDIRVAQMEELRDGGVDIGMVFVGNSVAGAGFDPATYEERSCRPAYNASIGGASLQMLEHWVLEVVEPLADPEVVAVGLVSAMLNGASPAHEDFERIYLVSEGRQAFGRPPPWGDRLEDSAARVSHFVRLRTYFRNPALVVDRLRLGDLIAVGSRGEREFRGGQAYRPELFEPGAREALRDFRIGEDEIDALRAMASELQDREVRVVFVIMPVVSDDYFPLHPNGRSDYLAHVEAVESLAREVGATFVDARHLGDDPTFFLDFHHLNQAGGQRLTSHLAGELGETCAE